MKLASFKTLPDLLGIIAAEAERIASETAQTTSTIADLPRPSCHRPPKARSPAPVKNGGKS